MRQFLPPSLPSSLPHSLPPFLPPSLSPSLPLLQEVASLHAKLESTSIESVDIGHILDSRLEAAIEELREKSEMEIAQYKLEVEAAYKDKVWGCPSH